MRLRVDEDDGVRRHFRVVRLQIVLDGRVEVLCGRFFHHDHLGRQLRVRLGNLERLEGCSQRRRLKLEVKA